MIACICGGILELSALAVYGLAGIIAAGIFRWWPRHCCGCVHSEGKHDEHDAE
ncbi:hypothetical protein SH661x_001819 [Planctomicrobium sp. SH661]|uniref:hypothetical protein n=1 Tax=Planctomicrobium sp. SH661 TaxID=3448124 RepID=UPI003F5AE805